VFLVLATLGLATLWMGVAADMGATLLVIGNSMRLLWGSNGSGILFPPVGRHRQ
jgi:cation transport ATPase